jgi:cold-inducible RNA-binding protein
VRAAFSRFGEVASAKVMSDRRGRTKGFAYVQMADEAEAVAAMEALRGTELNGRMMDVSLEESSRGRPRPQRSGRRR